MALLAKDLVPKVEAALARALLSGDRVYTDTQLREKATARYSVEAMIDYMEWGSTHIAMLVKAAHLSALQDTRQPNAGAWDLKGALRLMGNRNRISAGAYASRRTKNDHLDKEGRKASASVAYPVYVHENGEHLFRSTSDNPNDARSIFIKLGERVVQTGTGYVVGATGALNISTVISLGQEHVLTKATVNGIDVGITQVDDTETAVVDYDANIGAVGDPKAITVFRPAFHLLDSKFDSALVQFAVSLCKAIYGVSKQSANEMETALDLFYQEIEMIRLPMFTT